MKRLLAIILVVFTLTGSLGIESAFAANSPKTPVLSSNIKDTAIVYSWSNTSPTGYYKLYINDTQLNKTLTRTVKGTSYTYDAGKAYNYLITAYVKSYDINKNKLGDKSNSVEVVPFRKLTLKTEAEEEEIDLSWGWAGTDWYYDKKIDGYELYKCTDEKSPSLVCRQDLDFYHIKTNVYKPEKYRVRSYVKINGKTYYSDWSNVVSATPKKIPVKKVYLDVKPDHSKGYFVKGCKGELTYELEPWNSNYGTAVTFSSSNTKIVEVNSKGVFTAKKSGSATLTAKVSSGAKGTTKVYVNPTLDVTSKNLNSCVQKLYKFIKKNKNKKYSTDWLCLTPKGTRMLEKAFNNKYGYFPLDDEYNFYHNVLGDVYNKKGDDNKHYYMTYYDCKVIYKNITKAQNLKKEIKKAVKSCKAYSGSTLSKTKKIALWIAGKLTYDNNKVTYKRVSTPYEALKKGKGNCNAYSEIFYFMTKEAGISSSQKVLGAGKSGAHFYYHAWNRVKVSETYYYTDVTYYDSCKQSSYINSSKLWGTHRFQGVEK